MKRNEEKQALWSHEEERSGAWNSWLFTTIRSLPNCYVWTESSLVYPSAQPWLHALAPLGWLSPVLRLRSGSPQCVPPPEPTGVTPGRAVTVSPVVTNKPHLPWTMIIKPCEPRRHSFSLGERSWTHFCQCQMLAWNANYLKGKLPGVN